MALIHPRWDTICTLSYTYGQFRVANPPTDMYFGDGRKPEELEEIYTSTGIA